MKSSNSWFVVGVIVVITLTSVSAEIHRAKNAPTYQYRLKKPHAGQNIRRVDKDELDNEISKESWLDEKVWGHSRKTWILSCISSALVGTTGIIPLLIIPANCGFNIKSEASGNRMKSLLSFAVGGLLGDVFLHLLPEAWSHVDDYGPKLYGYRYIGMWFLCGLLSFYLVEKLVGGEDDEEEEEKEDEEEEESLKNEEESVEESSDNDEKMRFSKLIMRERKDEPTNKKSKELRQRRAIKNEDESLMDDDKGDVVDKDKTSNSSLRTSEEGSVTDVPNGKVIVKDDDEKEEVEDESNKPEKIKVSGWLNLLANIVDNFTHGLAVAGSYCISPKMGLLTTFAILLHEIPHEIGDFAILLKAGFNRWKAAKAQLMTASGGLIGTLVALSAESVKSAGDVTAWILPFTAGGFVNIAMVTILPDLTNEKNPKQSMKQLFIVMAGIMVMGLVTALVE